MRVTKRHYLLPFLRLLEEFLNQNFQTRTWKAFLGNASKLSGTVAHEFRSHDGIERAKALQSELRALLRPIVQFDDEFYTGLGALLLALNSPDVKHLLRLRPANKKAAHFAETSYKPLRAFPERKLFEVHGTKWALDSTPTILDAKSYFFSIIASALQEGELSRLRQCQCKIYFVAADSKQKFHDDTCRSNYWNERRLKSGYFQRTREMRKRMKK